MDANNKTIQFIDSEYKELFHIPDGGSVKITFPPGDLRGFAVRECSYVDETHFQIKGNGSDTCHICQFAELMERLGNRYEPAFQLRNAEIVPFKTGEEKYLTYNREAGNTCIGHIAGSFGQQGDRFHGSWSGRDNGRDTSEFHTELHGAVYALRQGLLKDHGAMLAFCQAHPEARLPGRDGHEHYGFKMDTDARRYYVFCAAEAEARDSRFIIYAYDKPAHILEKTRLPEPDDGKPSVMERIKAANKEQKPLVAPKPGLGKKNAERELR